MSKLTDLIDGYRRFRENEWSQERQRWAELAEGQQPKVMVIACSDSRVDPGQIFDTRPGEISVPANATVTTTYTFEEPGELIYGCHIFGHYDYGMRGAVEVR